LNNCSWPILLKDSVFGADGMHFRKAGIPTWAVSGLFMNPDEMYAHGLNERVPIKAFYDALDRLTICWNHPKRSFNLIMMNVHY